MLDLEEEIAFAIFTADTCHASRDEWERWPRKDKYRRFARAAINTTERLSAAERLPPL